MAMEQFTDMDLTRFERDGAAPLPSDGAQGYVLNNGARIWYACFGSGPAVILLHGGLGHSGNWGYQVPALTARGYRVVLIDARGHGRSTRDSQPYAYELMTTDVVAVMNELSLDRAAFVGWSDGACVALVLAHDTPARVGGVLYFACNMDPSGTRPLDESNPVIGRCFRRHVQDYARLSATPDQFNQLVEDVGAMQRTQPNYSADDLARISVPVTVAQSEHDEFITREHAEYLARTIPGAKLVLLRGVSHFAPLQHPRLFNETIIEFLGGLKEAGVRGGCGGS
jgi:pimeloyl-ACP methyl ester carboxylesterase